MYSKGLMIKIASKLRHLFPNVDTDGELKKKKKLDQIFQARERRLKMKN